MQEKTTKLLEEYLNQWHALEAEYIGQMVKSKIVVRRLQGWTFPTFGVVKAMFPLTIVSLHCSGGFRLALKRLAKGEMSLSEAWNTWTPHAQDDFRIAIEDAIKQLQEKDSIDLNILTLDGRIETLDIQNVTFTTPDEIMTRTLTAINGALYY